jgi:penicillin-binding protein 2
MLLGFASLGLCLFYYQMIRGNEYFRLSENNRLRFIPFDAPRGLIFDRNGQPIVDNYLSFDLELVPQWIDNLEETFLSLSRILEIDSARLRANYKRNYRAPFAPVLLAQDIDKAKALAIDEADQLKGVIVQARARRHYLYPRETAHLIGYLGRVSKAELEKYQDYGLRREDFLGKSGLEAYYDQFLRGENGGMQVEVDNRGFQRRILGYAAPKNGAALYTTIDLDLQVFTSQTLSGHTGAIVIMQPESGEILAMTSSPDYNPNIFLRTEQSAQISDLLHDAQAPLLNRAVSGEYPPGSIFKIVVACAGLQSGKINATTFFNCPGYLSVGKRKFFCWNRDGHGAQNLEQAIIHSCNVFFYNLGLKLDPDRLSAFAEEFGLGRLTQIDLPSERKGFVPKRQWKEIFKGEKWYRGETVNFAIGQGYLLVTPLQICRLIACVANGGYLVRPYLAFRIGDQELHLAADRKISVSEAVLAKIRQALRQVVCQESGTGHKADTADLEFSAKTGTAQAASGRDHAWFCGYFPQEKPEVCIVIFLEHGGSGGDLPAEMAKKIGEYYVAKKKPS